MTRPFIQPGAFGRIFAEREPKANHEGMKALFASQVDRLAAEHAQHIRNIDAAIERIRSERREG